MEMLGNASLLHRVKVGFLAGSKIAPASVLPSLDWASAVAAREDVAIVGGFNSTLERQILGLLLRGRCGIICVLARKLYAKVPQEYTGAFDSGRILFITNEKQAFQSKASASRRNRLILSMADEMYIPQIAPESSINKLLAGYYSKPLTIL